MATYVSKIEEIYDGIINFVWTNLPTVITSMNTIANDGITLEMFRDKLLGQYDLSNVLHWPTLIIQPATIQVNPPGKQRPMQKNLFIVNLSFWAVAQGTNTDTLQRMVFRYADVIRRIVDGPDYQPSDAIIADSIRQVTAVDFHQSVKEGQFIKEAVFVDVSFEVQVQRD